MNPIPTIRVKDGDGFKVINKSDFDADIHELFVEDEAQEPDDDKVSTPVDIPEDWRSWHWASQAKLAVKIYGNELVVPDDQTQAVAAILVIEAELQSREDEAQE